MGTVSDYVCVGVTCVWESHNLPSVGSKKKMDPGLVAAALLYYRYSKMKPPLVAVTATEA
jgi:hypothetical protein